MSQRREVLELVRRVRTELESIHGIEDPKKIFEQLNTIIEHLFSQLAQHLKLDEYRHAEKTGRWNIEDLDSAIEKISDRFGSSYAVIDLWDTLWELKTKKEISKEDIDMLIEKLCRVLDVVEKRVDRAFAKKRKR